VFLISLEIKLAKIQVKNLYLEKKEIFTIFGQVILNLTQMLKRNRKSGTPNE